MKKLSQPLILKIISSICFLSSLFSLSSPGKAMAEDLPSLTSATSLATPLALPSFHLRDEAGNPFTAEQFKNHWSLVFFGFTHCQTICPLTLTVLQNFTHTLEKEHKPLPQVVFITLDPERDTEKELSPYVHAFDRHFKGLRGQPEDIEVLSKSLGVVALHVPSSSTSLDNNYQIDHSGSIFLINPAGKWTAVFSPPFETGSITHDYRILTERYFSD